MTFQSREEAVAHTYGKVFHYMVEFDGEPIHGWSCYTPEGDKVPKEEIENFQEIYDSWMSLFDEEL